MALVYIVPFVVGIGSLIVIPSIDDQLISSANKLLIVDFIEDALIPLSALALIGCVLAYDEMH